MRFCMQKNGLVRMPVPVIVISAFHKRKQFFYGYDAADPGRIGACKAMATGVQYGGPKTMVVKEGYLNKKGGILKGWSKRYFMLNKQSLVYFRKEQELSADVKSDLRPMGRIFLSDIISIDAAKEGTEQRRAFVFTLQTKKRVIYLQASGSAEQRGWVAAIQRALESEGEAEKRDPFRRTLRRLAPGM